MKSIIDKRFIPLKEIKESKWTGFHPHNHLKALIMKKEEKEEPWYVVVTKDNYKELAKWRNIDKDYLLNYLEHKRNYIVGMSVHNKVLQKGHNPITHIKTDTYDFGKEISTQEFYRRIGKLKSTNYEIYY